MIRKTILWIITLWALSGGAPTVFGASQTVSLPLTIDYPFIRMVIIDQLYNQPEERAIVVDETSGAECSRIEMWQPEVRPQGHFITIGSNISVKAGAPILGKCVQLLQWEGYIEMTQRVVLDEATLRLKFETVDSHVYKTNRQPVAVATTVWDLIKSHVHPFFSRFAMDLSFPTNEVKSMIPLFFTADERCRVEAWMTSLKFGEFRVENDAIRLMLTMMVETAPPVSLVPEAELSSDEFNRITSMWETWDAFLVFQIESLLGAPLTFEEQQALFEILMDARYGFINALNEKTPGQDLVRTQFIRTWQNVAGILRTHLVKKANRGDLIKYLAFFTAADALTVLDKIGPAVNLEISRDGLLRLARLLSGQDISLSYTADVDTNLRMVLGFGPPMDDTGPSYPVMELPFPEDELEPPPDAPLSKWMQWVVATAYAADSAQPDVEALKPWIVPKDNLAPYLDRLRQVLEKTADENLSKIKLDSSYRDLYRLMIMATAWQESCWRQFIRSEKSIKPIFSYNQSSVGVMQINERVWRGVYKIDSLRWNIEYNARAGAEILGHYLKDYALKKMNPANPLDNDTLGRIVYAMYNGGPGQFQEFLKRSKNNTFYESDKLFWDKYTMAKSGAFDRVSVCLIGK